MSKVYHVPPVKCMNQVQTIKGLISIEDIKLRKVYATLLHIE
jgi:hypothetical protein